MSAKSGWETALNVGAVAIVYRFFFRGCMDFAQACCKTKEYKPKYTDDGRPDYAEDDRFTQRQKDYLNSLWDQSTDAKRRR